MINESENQKALLSYGSIDYDNMTYSGIGYELNNKNIYDIICFDNVEILGFAEHLEYTAIVLKGYDYVALCSRVDIGFCTNVPKKNDYVYWLVPSKTDTISLIISKAIRVKNYIELPYKMKNAIYIVENDERQSFALQLYK